MDRHATVAVFIVCQQKTLLHWHAKHSMWLPLGGHVDPNESACEAAVREAKEEAGIEVELFHPRSALAKADEHVRPLVSPVHVQNEIIGPDHEHIDYIFYGTANTFETQLEYPDMKLGWYDREELNSLPLADDVRAYALEALELIK